MSIAVILATELALRVRRTREQRKLYTFSPLTFHALYDRIKRYTTHNKFKSRRFIVGSLRLGGMSIAALVSSPVLYPLLNPFQWRVCKAGLAFVLFFSKQIFLVSSASKTFLLYFFLMNNCWFGHGHSQGHLIVCQQDQYGHVMSCHVMSCVECLNNS
jgi:hypothetical protein